MKLNVLPLALIVLLTGCGDSTYTLYRTQVRNENARTHVATFDAKDGSACPKTLEEMSIPAIANIFIIFINIRLS